MELWDQEAIDLLGPACITFGAKNEAGELQFIAVHGWMDCRYTERESAAGLWAVVGPPRPAI